MTLRCAVLDDYQHAARAHAAWRGLGGVAVDFLAEKVEDTDVPARLGDYDILVAMRERTRFADDTLAALPRLRLLVTTGMTNAAIDLDGAARRGIVVSGTRGTIGPTAELAWGLLLSVMRNLPAEVANLRALGPWHLGVGRRLEGLTLGVAGYGRLGARVARYGLAFGMKVVAWSRSRPPGEDPDGSVRFVGTPEELLSECDVLSVHLRLTDDTRRLFGRRQLELLRPSAVIVNTSRGEIFDEDALVDILVSGRIHGAGLDVFEREPLPQDHPFRRLENVVATPHLGYVTDDTYDLYFTDAVDDIRAWLAGTPVRVLTGAEQDVRGG